jgi:hypothetical protein
MDEYILEKIFIKSVVIADRHRDAVNIFFCAKMESIL